MQKANTTQVTPNYSVSAKQWSFSMQNPRSWMWKHMPLLRAGAAYTTTQEVLLFHLQRNASRVLLLEIILSKDTHLLWASYLRAAQTNVYELYKNGYSFWVSKCSLPDFTDHNLASTLIKMTPSSFPFYCFLCSNEFKWNSFTMQPFFQNVVLVLYNGSIAVIYVAYKGPFSFGCLPSRPHRLWKNSNQKWSLIFVQPPRNIQTAVLISESWLL